LLAVVGMLFAGCAPLVVTASPREILTTTPSPTRTFVSTATSTSVPMVVTFDATILNPTGAPAKTWKGLRIMPTALKGDGDDCGYRFLTDASIGEIEQFYDNEMLGHGAHLADFGWNAGYTIYSLRDGSYLIITISQEIQERLVWLS